MISYLNELVEITANKNFLPTKSYLSFFDTCIHVLTVLAVFSSLYKPI